ncbi:MAG: M15 family metallopeptidase [Actinomycetota bacterium]
MRPIPELRGTAGWREVPIDPVDEPLVRVADVGGRVREDPQYFRMELPGAEPGCWVRQGVADRLVRAADALPAGLSLVVWDGHRSLETQGALWDAFVSELIVMHADWPADAIEEEAARYVTPPSHSPMSPPPHLTGGAVDVTLAGPDGRELDLGTPFDAFVPEAAARALEGVDVPARDLRRVLFWAMAGQGFTSYVEEWWHFDYGDQFWGLVAERPARYEGVAAAPGLTVPS